MMLVKTNERIHPEPWMKCPRCNHKAEVTATRPADDNPEVWHDFYSCRHCHYDFPNTALLLWCDETGEFYAYAEAVDASNNQ